MTDAALVDFLRGRRNEIVDFARELVATPSVCPSGAADAVCATPSMVAAPGRLSTTTGRPSTCESLSP